MEYREVEIGQKYAYRERLSTAEPLHQVEVVAKTGRRGQVKIRRLSEPFEGLEEWVQSRQLVVRWGERKALLREEEQARRFDESRRKVNEGLVRAIETVMYSTGYSDAGAEVDGTIRMDADELREIARRAGLSKPLEEMHSAVYIDRRARMRLPVEVAEQLAQAFAKAEPETVLMFIEDEEREYKARGYEPGERFYHDWLREHMPGYALVRYWAGHQAEVASLQAENERLRALVRRASDALVENGAEREGQRIRRALERG